MNEASAFDPGRFLAMVGKVGHGRALGISYVAHGADWVEIALPWSRELVGIEARGVLASGPIISLMDMATSMATWVSLGGWRAQATLDFRVDYLRAARPGETVLGRGETISLKRSIAFVRGTAHDGNPADPIAHVTGTFMAT